MLSEDEIADVVTAIGSVVGKKVSDQLLNCLADHLYSLLGRIVVVYHRYMTLHVYVVCPNEEGMEFQLCCDGTIRF
jgi:hypothetical protein